MPLESNFADAIRSYTLPIEENPYEALIASVRFEDVGKGRQGAVLTQIDAAGHVPLVRTTTQYRTPAQRFRSLHVRLAAQIQDAASLAVGFNNALIEQYSNAYTTMGSHSDQSLDLAEESFIAVFSCYKHPENTKAQRKLIVESKAADGAMIAMPMFHNSVLLFSLNANRRLKHKIVLETSNRTPENTWLGMTLRTSKTMLRFHDERAYFVDDNVMLTLADDEQRREFYQLRRRENTETDFVYPRIAYTISESDLMPPC